MKDLREYTQETKKENTKEKIKLQIKNSKLVKIKIKYLVSKIKLLIAI